MFTDERLELARREPRTVQSHMSMLVPARALEIRNFEAWVNAVWTQVTTTNVNDDWDRQLRDTTAEILKTLIVYLRSPAFEFNVDVPKWRWSPSPRH